MDIFEKREIVLDLQQSMLIGAKKRDDDFLSLVNFENWCCNSGLSGFAQDYKESDLKSINDFSSEHNFIAVSNMISVFKKYLKQYGSDFIDKLNDKEYEDLSQYDNDFFDIHDQYTDAIYNKYIANYEK